MYSYTPKGVCSKQMTFDIVDHKVVNAKIVGGCSGNTQGVCALIEGMDVDEAIKRISGIKCGLKPTSCPDQLSRALKQALASQE